MAKYYNLYYNNVKINNRPINENDLDTIKKSRIIAKRNPITNKLESISFDKIEVVKTILI